MVSVGKYASVGYPKAGVKAKRGNAKENSRGRQVSGKENKQEKEEL